MTKKTKNTKPKKIERTPKEEKLFQNLLAGIKQYIHGKGFVPMTEHDLSISLGFPEQHFPLISEILHLLVKEKLLTCKVGRYELNAKKDDVVSGTLRVHSKGFAFLQPDDPVTYPQDVFIPKHFVHNAVDGDKVEVEINKAVFSEKGPEGRVVAILSRSRTHMAGTISFVEPDGDIVAYVPLLGVSQRVIVQPSAEKDLVVGDRIVMEVIDWGSKQTETFCKFSHYLGHISDPSCDVKAAIEEYELRSDFSHAMIEEAKKIGTRVSTKEILTREDLRDLESFTIDPDTAKDYDDALSISKDKKGRYHLAVHIADVSHYVQPGTKLDAEAMERCNSTYFPNFCLPMLPSVLSDNLCSLKPKVNRLTVTIFMDFDADGTMSKYRIARTVINSAKRFTYREAKAVLDNKKKSIHRPSLELLVELCGLLKKKRYERGSIEFCLPELVVIVDENGVPYKTDYVEYDVTHQLVEECMLKANETVATHLSDLGKNLTYRIHDTPAKENMKDFSLLVGAFGFHLSQDPQPPEIQKLFDEALNSPYGPYLATSYIRRMRLASYSPDNIGHYGLGLTHYCHFTSPIRRYVDLVAHRLLFGESDNREQLALIATKCSEKERISAKAESQVVLLKKLRLLNQIFTNEPLKQFEAVVTRIKPFGIYFEVIDFMLEGFLHISELGDDYYIFEESEMRLRGRRTGAGFTAGERITVMPKKINLILLDSAWNIVSEPRRPLRTSAGKKHQRPPSKHRGSKQGKAKSSSRKMPPKRRTR